MTSGLSARAIRRLTQPFLFKFWFSRGAGRTTVYRVDGLEIRVEPTVFHPKYFGSSLIFARFIETLDLAGKRVLDMGTGSGIIGLYAAKRGGKVTAVDINPAAVQCAEANSRQTGRRIRAIVSDLFSNLGAEKFDVIAWNPPFFPRSPSTLAEAALYAGPDHEVIRRFAEEASRHLVPGGRIYLVFSEDGGLKALESIFRSEEFIVQPVQTTRWGFAETMVILEIHQ